MRIASKHPKPLSPNHGSVLHLLLSTVAATTIKVENQRLGHALDVELSILRATSTVCSWARRPAASTLSFRKQTKLYSLHVGQTTHGLHVELQLLRSCQCCVETGQKFRRSGVGQFTVDGVAVYEGVQFGADFKSIARCDTSTL